MSHDDDVELILELEEKGQYARALAICELLHARAPEEPFITHMLGTLQLRMGNAAPAAENLGLAVETGPGIAAYHARYAEALKALGRLREAGEHFRRAAAIDHTLTGARLHAARCFVDTGAVEEARAEIDAADLNGNPDVMAIAAHICLDAGRPAEALALTRKGLAATPGHGPCRGAVIAALVADGDVAAAAAELETAFDQGRAGADAAMLAHAILPRVTASAADLTRARAAYERAVGRLGTVEATASLDAVTGHGTHFMAAYQGVDDAPCRREIAAFYSRICPALNHLAPLAPKPPPGERLRMGFLSAHFHNHTVGKLFRGLIAEMDRARFEVHVFATTPPGDEIGRFIAERCDRYHVLPPAIAPARDAIAAARPHILFYADIGMEPLSYFLAFSRLAPLQCVGWGHPVTTGIPAMDLFISGADLEADAPVPADTRYAEELVRLAMPPAYLYPPRVGASADNADLDLPEGRSLYVCAQALFKIHPDFDRLLADILARDPDGMALFIDGKPGWSAALKSRWRTLIPRLDERVRFLPRMDQERFFALLSAAHVVLDTVHFSGGITSAEALSLGKAVVTWPGTLMPGRVTHAYYRQMGIEELSVGSAEDYVATAVRLGTDGGYRAAMEERIAAAAPRLFHRTEVVRELEDVLTAAYRARLS